MPRKKIPANSLPSEVSQPEEKTNEIDDLTLAVLIEDDAEGDGVTVGDDAVHLIIDDKEVTFTVVNN